VEPAIIAAVILGGCLLIALAAIRLRVINEYERGVILRFGRRGPLLAPGLRLVLPLRIDRLIRVDLRSSLLKVPMHEVITRDGVPVRVSAAVQFQVVDPVLAVTRVVDYRESTAQLVHAALRDVVARMGLRDLLLDQEAVRDALARFMEARTEPWGIRITSVDPDDIELPDAMRRAMAQQAERRAEQRPERLHAPGSMDAADLQGHATVPSGEQSGGESKAFHEGQQA
jgi:regulator of protease activity HflC (stomatin/prohibitin superfamily)